MATLAELELELCRERRAASRECRRARPLPATKPHKLTSERQEQLRRLAATGEPVHELAKAFGISRATAYRYLSQLDDPVKNTMRNLPICTSSPLASTAESTGSRFT